MALYGLLESGVFTGRLRDFNDTPPDISHKNMEWRPFIQTVEPAYNPITHDLVHGATVNLTNITETWQIVAVDAIEEAARQEASDLTVLREAGKDTVLVLIELIEWTLDNTGMVPADFSLDVRQAFLDLQTIADRLRAP